MESRLVVSQKGKMPLKQPEHSLFHLGTFPLNKSRTVKEKRNVFRLRILYPREPSRNGHADPFGFPNLLPLVDWITRSAWSCYFKVMKLEPTSVMFCACWPISASLSRLGA